MAHFLSFTALTAAALLLSALLPDAALAWGPGAHMVTGNWVLQNLNTLPFDVAAALMQHPGHFLHGALSADIFIGKGCKAKKGHSHNWESGFTLLEKTRNSEERAYAYGYLAHLAADTVAHNVFVPGLFHTVPGGGKVAHVYLEAQADRLLAWDKSDALSVFRGRRSRRNESLLQASLRRPSLAFRLQSRLFRGSIALCGSRAWRASMRFVDGLLPHHEHASLLEAMLGLSTRAIVNLLQHGQDSSITTLDPIGANALAKSGKKEDDSLTAAGLAMHCLGLRSAKAAEPELQVSLPETLSAVPPVCGHPSEPMS